MSIRKRIGAAMWDNLKPVAAVAGLIFAGGTWFGACRVQGELKEHIVEEKEVHRSQNEKLDLILKFTGER